MRVDDVAGNGRWADVACRVIMHNAQCTELIKLGLKCVSSVEMVVGQYFAGPALLRRLQRRNRLSVAMHTCQCSGP
jgi:hypothetical protein